MNTAPTRLLIADDHVVVRLGLVSMLAIEEDLEIIAEACNGEQAVVLYEQHRPDVMLLDVRMPGFGGIEALRRIRALNPEAIALMLSTSELETEVALAFEAGAVGYILKTENQETLVAAIRAAAQGRRLFTSVALARIADRRKLSRRELDVLQGMSRGLANKEIAGELGISEHTVKCYVKTLLDKLDAPDRAGARSSGFAHGWLKVG
ncbi:MAG: response regulator transcription factor [Akkermansiaceae bacterium]|nr:response regulator transcription factor [Akkermansiaceae bacterium]